MTPSLGGAHVLREGQGNAGRITRLTGEAAPYRELGAQWSEEQEWRHFPGLETCREENGSSHIEACYEHGKQTEQRPGRKATRALTRYQRCYEQR